jgi:SAM-dependent methyltransferase
MAPVYEPHPIEWTREKAGRLWDFYGRRPGVDALYFSVHSGRAVARYLQRRVPLRGRRVLDFGCGRGGMLAHLLGAGAECTGLEFSEASAATAAERVGRHPLARGVVVAKGLPAPLPDGGFDIVLLVEVIEHLLAEDLEPTLAELRRLVRPGGHTLVTTPNAEDLTLAQLHCPDCGASYHQWQHVRRFEPETLTELMARAGFERVACEALFFRPSLGPFDRMALELNRLHARLRGRHVARPHLAYLGRKPA